MSDADLVKVFRLIPVPMHLDDPAALELVAQALSCRSRQRGSGAGSRGAGFSHVAHHSAVSVPLD